jgi:acyl-coenzyme A synthetase/AMP-(fatty) acid ligase
VKSVVFGSRRSGRAGREPADPLDAALAPALEQGRWRVPGRFNFTRDVVEVLARDSKRVALTAIGRDGVIEPRTFLQLAQGAARWTALLHERGVRPGDRVLVAAPAGPAWVEVLLAAIKSGAVAVPCAETLPAEALDIRIAATRAKLVVGSRDAEGELARAGAEADVVFLDEARREAHRFPKDAPTHDTSARDPAVIVTTAGRANGPRGVLHTHAAVFSARAPAEHWLDAREGDVVWCTAGSESAQVLWSGLFGPLARGAQVVLQEGPIDPVERLELVHRLGVTILCQRPAEYRAVAETGHLARFRSVRPRRLVSSGDRLGTDLVALFEEQWGLKIHDGYGQAETGIIAGHSVADGYRAEAIGRALPGYELAVIDGGGRPLPAGGEGMLALSGRPPSLFAAYWNGEPETRAAFRGDWYLTGDAAAVDEHGCFHLLDRTPRPYTAPPPEPQPEPDPVQPPAPVRVPPRAPAVAEPAARAVTRPASTPPQPASKAQQLAPPKAAAAKPARPAPVPPRAAPPKAAKPEPAPVPPKAPEPEQAPVATKRAPLWARATAVVWLLLLGVLVGGAAIPHANDEPRVVPRHEVAPGSICLPPKPRG